LFSEFVEMGCRKYYGYLERIIGEDILDRDISIFPTTPFTKFLKTKMKNSSPNIFSQLY